MSRSRQVAAQLERIADEFIKAVQAEHGELPTAPVDSEWPSVCIQTQKNTELVYWKPVRRPRPPDFSGLEKALEQPFPMELSDFYGHFWSAAIPVTWGDRSFELLQLWNSDDENNLMHNFLGHALEKKRAREELTLFFGVVDDERFLSCDVLTGVVMLEEVGGHRPQPVADSLPALLEMISGCAGAGVAA